MDYSNGQKITQMVKFLQKKLQNAQMLFFSYGNNFSKI